MKPVDYESQELSIHFYPADRNGTARVYTTIPSWMDKLDELCENSPEGYKLIKNDGYGKKYEVNMKRISFRHDPSEAMRNSGKRLGSLPRSSEQGQLKENESDAIE